MAPAGGGRSALTNDTNNEEDNTMTGRRIAISGAGSGIGRQVAIDFAAAGDTVVLLGRREAALRATAEEIGATANLAAIVWPVDLGTPQCEESLRALAATGPFDAVVATAGGNAELRQDAPALVGLASTTWHWQENFRLNVLTAVHLIDGLNSLAGLAPGAAVVLLSSIAAYRGSGTGSYAATKLALHAYALDLAKSLAESQIRVNVVAPGFVAGTEFFRDRMTADRHQRLVAQTLDGRAGSVSDISATVQWLCSPAASHITGQVIQVNGGAHVSV
jgi:3-oxoacyl-[acyl-carrier protein] reductase